MNKPLKPERKAYYFAWLFHHELFKAGMKKEENQNIAGVHIQETSDLMTECLRYLVVLLPIVSFTFVVTLFSLC